MAVIIMKEIKSSVQKLQNLKKKYYHKTLKAEKCENGWCQE